MSELSAVSASLQNVQQQVQNELSMMALKQAAQAEQALADMLAQQARALAETQQKQQAAGGGINIYV
jgi:hypothetical protein